VARLRGPPGPRLRPGRGNRPLSMERATVRLTAWSRGRSVTALGAGPAAELTQLAQDGVETLAVDVLHAKYETPPHSPTPKTGTMCCDGAAPPPGPRAGNARGASAPPRRGTGGLSRRRAGRATPAPPHRPRPCRPRPTLPQDAVLPQLPRHRVHAGFRRRAGGAELFHEHKRREQVANAGREFGMARRVLGQGRALAAAGSGPGNSSAKGSSGSWSRLGLLMTASPPGRPGACRRISLSRFRAPEVALPSGGLRDGEHLGGPRRWSAARSAAGPAPRGRADPGGPAPPGGAPSARPVLRPRWAGCRDRGAAPPGWRKTAPAPCRDRSKPRGRQHASARPGDGAAGPPAAGRRGSASHR